MSLIENILKEDSILKVISNLSTQLTYKFPSLNKAENSSKKRDLFKLTFEILLNKRHSDVIDSRCNYQLEELITELIFHILYRNKGCIKNDVRKKIIAKVDRLAELARQDSDSLHIVKSILRIILLINDNLPLRELNGILKYREPIWFMRQPYQRNKFREINRSSDPNFRSMVCIKENFDSLFFSLGKIKKSATWHDGVMSILSSSPATGTSSFARPLSQTLLSQDEGFVTPDDNHVEVTPEPSKDFQRDPSWWCTLDILETPPSQYKTWESQWIMPTVRESNDLKTYMEISYSAMRVDLMFKGLPIPPALENFIKIDQLALDVISLLCGLPSSTFQLCHNNKFKLVYGTYTEEIMPNCLLELVDPFIKFGQTYRNIESFIEKKKFFDQIIPQAFLLSLHEYLYKLKSTLLLDVDKIPCKDLWKRLKIFTLNSLHHLEYLWNIINVEDNMTCHQILSRMYASLTFINDDVLLNIANIILLKCCYIYISLFEKYINTGVCVEELMCNGSGSLSVDKVPDFLRPLVEVINNSSKTLQLLHKDPKMSLLKIKVSSKKPEKPLPEPVDHRETLKEHYIKYMKEKEKEKTAIAKKKSEQLNAIKEDIIAKQKWKELEAMEIEMKERKMQDRFEKLDAIKQQYINDCKKEVEIKYEAMLRESEKKIAVANWKLKRLTSENSRSGLIKNNEIENQFIREKFLKDGIDLSKTNKNIVASPVKIAQLEIKTVEYETEAVSDIITRHEEASEIKKRMLGGDEMWKHIDENDDERIPETVRGTPDFSEEMKLYEENRNKALEIKKKIMSSELELNCLPDLNSPDFNGLSPNEREDLEKDLIVFLPDNSYDISSYLKTSTDFLQLKLEVKNTLDSPSIYKFHSGPLNFIEMRHVFLKSAKDYLNKQVEFASRVMLEHVKDDFIREVRWIVDHYLLMNGVWVSAMSKKLLKLVRQGTIDVLVLNRLFPPPLTVRTFGSPPAIFNPNDPSTIDFLILTYQPIEPLHNFITERFLLKYNMNFVYLVKIELASQMLKDSLLFLRNRISSNCGLQYNQIHFHVHVMHHFVLSMKSFVCVAFEKCWEKFIKDTNKVTSLDDLHNKHIRFIRNVQYYCLYNKRSSKILDIHLSLLSHIYKYCETLRCGILSSNPEGGHLLHSMYPALIHHFQQYLIQSRKFYSFVVRISESGIAEGFSDLKEMLSINNFYSSL